MSETTRLPPPSSYLSAPAYAHQLETVIASSWHVIGDRSDFAEVQTPVTLLPGSLNEPLIVTRSKANSLRCLSNVCTHRGALLCDVPNNAPSIRCPYHGRRFDLGGEILSAPGFTAIPQQQALPQVPLVSLGPLQFGSLRPSFDLSNFLDEVAPWLAMIDLASLMQVRPSSVDYHVDAHFALWCENYLEGLHIPYVHPKLAARLDLQHYDIELLSQGSLQIAEAADDEVAFPVAETGPYAGRRIGGLYLFIYPTTALNFYPWGLSVNLVQPLGPRQTRIRYLTYVTHPEFREQGAGAGLDTVEAEDDAVVARCQRGTASRLYQPGTYAPAEAAVAHFHRWLASHS